MTKPMDKQPKYEVIIQELNDYFQELNSILVLRDIPLAKIERYREEFDILSSYTSNAIEGNTFTYDEVRLLLKEGVTTSKRSLREHNDIAGHSRAYRSLYVSLKNGELIDVDFILNLHAKVLQGDDFAGRFRNAAVYVGNSITVSYVAPDSDKVPRLINDYIKTVQPEMRENITDLKGVENVNWLKFFFRIAKHHIEFERIHPFFDGNGRTGRLLLNYELISAGLPPIIIPLENRVRYGAAFENYERKAKYSTRQEESKYERMAKILAESQLNALKAYYEYLIAV